MKKESSLAAPFTPTTLSSCRAIAPALICAFGVFLLGTIRTQAQAFSDWSAPANIGPAINSSASDQQPAISPDGLSLYFTSNRAGGVGGFDMYVSHRASVSDAWGTAVNLGTSLNTSSDEGNAAFSLDGLLLFFQSKRPGGLGGIDLWMTRRANVQDDFGWQPAVNLGAAVNSSADDNGPAFLEDQNLNNPQLYFGSTRSGGPGGADLYVSQQLSDGSFAAATLVPELNSIQNENDPTIRQHGLEIIFQSNRSGSLAGSSDLWVSTRPALSAPWSTPVNLVSTINTTSAEQNAYIASDGLTLYFSSDRAGGSGGADVYVSTRAKICRAGEMYGASPFGAIVTINQLDASATAIHSSTEAFNGLAFDSRGRLFASSINVTSKLFQLDPDTGATIGTIGPIAVNGVLISIGDLAFQPGTDVLFGVRSNADHAGAGGQLFTINVTTGAATFVGDTGAGASGGIAFAPNGNLYQTAHHANFDYASLNTIDPTDAHRIRTLPLTAYYDGLGFRPADGMLIATAGGGGGLFTINPDTAVESLLGFTGFSLSDIDFRNVCGQTNPIDDPEFFVRQHYSDFLNRQPDALGLAYWSTQIAQCGPAVACVHERRIGVSGAFFIEMEFQDTGYFVYRFYKATFARQPTFAEFIADRGQVLAGPNIEASKQAFADDWVLRSGFIASYPNSMTNTEFVTKLFTSAGLAGSTYDVERQQQISAMNGGRSRALVLRQLIEISDFKNIADPHDPRYNEIKQISQYNPAFVLMQYFGYLRRNIDSDGYGFWLDVVNNRDPNNYRAMVCSFITSSEYQRRFGGVVTRSNADCGH